MPWPDPVRSALALSSGARFYRCALQVNPFAYHAVQGTAPAFPDEATYNAALVEACLTNGIGAIGLADHYRIKTSVSLMTEARKAGLLVFPGFEAGTKDGVHLLCLFDPHESLDKIERVIGDCGVHDDAATAPLGRHDVTEFLAESIGWGCVTIAVHAASAGGLLNVLDGKRRAAVWTDPNLLAIGLPGPGSDAPPELRNIVANADPQYKRPRPIAVVNANDINAPDDLAKPSTSTWIKMSHPSPAALRQAFLDPASRIRLASDPEPEDHAELETLTWEGGFLDGSAIHFNQNLNVVIGGRGSGKSTVIESIRTVLDLEPASDDAKTAHEGIMSRVLQSGTKVSMVVRSHQPAPRTYVIERTIPNPPIVRDQEGVVLDVDPAALVPRIEILGQHEIAELAKDKKKRTALLDRFVERAPQLRAHRAETRRALSGTRAKLVEVTVEERDIEEQMSALPALEETLRRFEDAGLELKLRDQALLLREERVLGTVGERIETVDTMREAVQRVLPLDLVFLSDAALEDLPARETLAGAVQVLRELEARALRGADEIGSAVAEARAALSEISSSWDDRKSEVLQAYEQILRDLQRDRVDGDEFMRLRREIEQMRPLQQRIAALRSERAELESRRRSLLAEWEEISRSEFQSLQEAASRVNSFLLSQVRVTVTFAGDRDPLIRILREEIGGRLQEIVNTLLTHETLSVRELAETMRAGPKDVADRYHLTGAQAERLAGANEGTLLAIEELHLPPTTTVKLNIASGDPAEWRELDELSTGQKATAILLLLLLESDSPLIIDQPEDDLDNRFISDGVVPRMREEKRRRQFIFATHNANIPVLGDAELIFGLEAIGEADAAGRGSIDPERMGSIDSPPVRDLVEELLEGGREAFEMRRLKYGF